MATGVQVWSQTAATNATADSNVNYAEGQAPSSLNDSSRAAMSSVAKWRDDNNGTLVTGGTSLAYTLVTNQIESALTAGYTVRCQFNVTNGAGATLAVDSLAAKPLQTIPGTNLTGGEYPANSFGNFTYSTTGTGQWIATPSPPRLPATVIFSGGAPVGTASASYVMMGLGATIAITPVRSSKVLVVLSFYSQSTAIGGEGSSQLAFGTGTAPINGAGASGTTFGGVQLSYAPVANAPTPGSLVGLMTGLTPGTAYWVDVQLKALVSGTIQIFSVGGTAVEI